MHSPVLNRGTEARRGSLHWPWLTSQQQPWGYPVLATRTFSTVKGIFGGGNPTLMSLGDISVQGGHYLCRLSAGAAPQSAIQPGWTLPSCAPSCAFPPHITSWNSFSWDLAVRWQPCAMHTSSESAHMVTKINPVCVYNLKEISQDLLYWKKRQKKIFWSHCLFLMVVLTGSPGEEKTKPKQNQPQTRLPQPI